MTTNPQAWPYEPNQGTALPNTTLPSYTPNPQQHWSNPQSCPSCGRCATCGRGGYYEYPYDLGYGRGL